MTPRDQLACGCGPSGPCPKGAEYFDRGPSGRQYLVWHLECALRDWSARRLHAWEHLREGAVLSRCRRCGAEQAAKQWRANGGAWTTGALPECVGRAAEIAKVRAARRRRAA